MCSEAAAKRSCGTIASRDDNVKRKGHVAIQAIRIFPQSPQRTATKHTAQFPLGLPRKRQCAAANSSDSFGHASRERRDIAPVYGCPVPIPLRDRNRRLALRLERTAAQGGAVSMVTPKRNLGGGDLSCSPLRRAVAMTRQVTRVRAREPTLGRSYVRQGRLALLRLTSPSAGEVPKLSLVRLIASGPFGKYAGLNSAKRKRRRVVNLQRALWRAGG